jgi:hypothetical protein
MNPNEMRDYFAGKAIAGAALALRNGLAGQPQQRGDLLRALAADAYAIADAMIAEREAGKAV